MFMRMSVCACLVPAKVREGIGASRPGVMDGCDPPCGFYEPNLGPLEEQRWL